MNTDKKGKIIKEPRKVTSAARLVPLRGLPGILLCIVQLHRWSNWESLVHSALFDRLYKGEIPISEYHRQLHHCVRCGKFQGRAFNL